MDDSELAMFRCDGCGLPCPARMVAGCKRCKKSLCPDCARGHICERGQR